MKRIAVAVAVIVVALGLVACGGGSSTGTSSESAEVAEAVKLIQRQKRLTNMKYEGIIRAGAIEESGSTAAARGMQEAAEDFGLEADELSAEIAGFSEDVQQQALDRIDAER